MTTASPPQSVDLLRARRAAVALLEHARRRGFVITRTKFAKLLYLADLRAVERDLRPFSGIEWKWLQHGPFNNSIFTLEADLISAGIIERTERETALGREVRLNLVKDGAVPPLAPEWDEIIEGVVGEYGGYPAVTLKDLTYQTAPMMAAQEEGRGVVLDLDLVRPIPDMSEVRRRMRAILARVDDDEGDVAEDAQDDVLASIEELSDHRAEANAELLR